MFTGLLFSDTANAGRSLKDLYWVVGEPLIWVNGKLTQLPIKFPDAESACKAGIALKEWLNISRNSIWDWRTNPNFPFYFGGSYSWRNLGKLPTDPGFDDSERTLYCNHEYSYPGRNYWLTYWPYSGATVGLQGDKCPDGFIWDNKSFGCKKPPEPPVTCEAKQCEKGGNPIGVIRGNKTEDVVDYTSRTLVFKRHYDSWMNYVDKLGQNWTHTYSKRLHFKTPDKLTLVRPDGGLLEYSKLPSGKWVSAFDSRASLKSIGNYYYYTTQNDQKEIYDDSGLLRQVIPSGGMPLTVYYKAKSSIIDRVEDVYGHALTFLYNGFGEITGITLPSGKTIHYQYGANNNLTTVIYPDDTPSTTTDNPRVVYKYENNAYPNHMTGLVDERGIQYGYYGYNNTGWAIASVHPNLADGVTFSYRYDLDARKIIDRRLTNLNGDTNYEVNSLLGTSVVTRVTGTACKVCQGYDTQYIYNDFSFNLQGKVIDGVLTQYGNYDSLGNKGYQIEAVGTPEERRTDYTYDPRFQSKVSSITKPSVFSGHQKVTSYEYDTAGHRTAIHINGFTPYGDAISRATTFEYNGPYAQLSAIDGPRTDVNDVTTLEYYPVDYPIQDNAGRLQRIVSPLGIVLRDNIQYTTSGKVLSEERPNGLKLSYTYTPRERLNSITLTSNGDSRTTQWTYLPTGEVETITFGVNSSDETMTTMHYDDARRLIGVTDPFGNSIEYELDGRGNRIGEKTLDKNGTLHSTLNRVIDQYNKIKEVIHNDGTIQYVNNPNGTIDTVIDAKNNSTMYDYDALKRLTQSVQPNSIVSSYTYDTQGQLTQVTDPNNHSTFNVIDDLGNILQVDSPDTALTTYFYDEAGNIVEKLDAKQQHTYYTYDANNRLTQATLAEGGIETYTYDLGSNAQGLLSQITSPFVDADGNVSTQTVSFEYNGFGEIIAKAQAVESQNLRVDYQYNTLGMVTNMRYPSGTQVQYVYFGGRVNAVKVNGQQILDGIEYTPLGQIKRWRWANGTEHQRNYDLDGRLASISNGLYIQQFSYDPNNNITSILNRSQSSLFDHDPLNRLTTFSDSFNGITTGYDYDANGNRTLFTQNGTTDTYSLAIDSNRLLSVSGTTDRMYQYDANGNTIDDGKFQFTYDSKNQLISVNNGDIARYDYNPLGQRVRKESKGNSADINGDGVINSQDLTAIHGPSAIAADCNNDGNPGNTDNGNGKSQGKGNSNGKDTSCIANQIGGNPNSPNTQDSTPGNTGNDILYYVYDEQGQLLGEYTDSVTAQQETIYLYGVPVAVIQNSVVYTVHTDHLNTPRALTDASNTVVWRWVGDPFGDTEADEDPDGDGIKVTFNQRFAGQYYDAETGLHYNYFRYYDPGTGRYITSDPIGILAGTTNTYAYVGGNPLRWYDRLGLYSNKDACLLDCNQHLMWDQEDDWDFMFLQNKRCKGIMKFGDQFACRFYPARTIQPWMERRTKRKFFQCISSCSKYDEPGSCPLQ